MKTKFYKVMAGMVPPDKVVTPDIQTEVFLIIFLCTSEDQDT